MKKNALLSVALMLALYAMVMAQDASVSNVLKIKSAKQSGQIIENDKLVGYFIFYFKEKADKLNSTYEIKVFDDNYNALKNFQITRPKNSALMEMVYNGEAFMLFFYDRKTGYEFVSYDRAGKRLGSKKIAKDDISKFDLQRSAAAFSSGTENVTVFPSGEGGFIRQSFSKGKKLGFSLVAYDNSMKKLWSYESPATSELIESAEINEVTAKYVTATVARKTSLMTKKADMSFIILNAESGKLIKELQMENEVKEKESVLKSFYDESLGKLVMVGEYYGAGDEIIKDKSKGLFIQEVDESGNVLNKKKFKWQGDVDKFKNEHLSEEDKKAANDAFYIFFHDVIRSSNGDLFLIGEQFKKQVSAAGVAMNVLSGQQGGKVSNFEIRVMNMVVIRFDSNNEMKAFDLVEKKKTSVLLPSGAGFYGPTFLGYYISNLEDGFDYSFTSRDKENDRFTIVYTDYNRKEDKDSKDKADNMLGVIQISGGTMETRRVPINTDAVRWWLQPAKPGYVSVTEYYKKEKKLKMRLEQLAY